ncbi:hypothetical protein [Sphingopyxis sp.]|uniref:hypothetical protein n=1 Tax=Sphingopyxis sp. TaxID=1908224 RepID=UPI003D6C7319
MSSSFPNRFVASSRLIAIGLLALVLAFFLAAKSDAQNVVTLEFDTNVLVSDNPFLTTEKERATGAVELVARPRAELKLDPRTDLDFTGEVGFRQYSRRYGNFVTGRSDLQLRHRRNEHLTVSGRATYARDLVSDSLTDSIDFAIDTRSIREGIDARTSVAWSPNATTTIVGDGGWRRLRYPGSTLLDTTKAYDFGLAANKRLSEKLTVGVQANRTLSHVLGGEDTSLTSLNATAVRRFSAHWYGGTQLGIEWSKLYDPISMTREGRARFNGAAHLCYEPERTSACLRSAIGSEVSGLGGLQREFSVGVDIRHRISEFGTVNAEADYRRAHLPGYDASARVFASSVGYEHRIRRNVYLTPSVAYLQRNRRAGEKADAFIFRIGLSIRGARS